MLRKTARLVGARRFDHRFTLTIPEFNVISTEAHNTNYLNLNLPKNKKIK
jgi:hypothetical protein